MTIRPSEANNLFWHCVLAAKVVDELKATPATNIHFVRCVRMATDCAIGKHGVQYASDGARLKAAGRPWARCGLRKEHAVPVRLICARVRSELLATRDAELPTQLVLSDEDTKGLPTAVVALFQQHPRAWQVAKIVREMTLMAWITVEEDDRFDDTTLHGGISIRACMPLGWTEEQGWLARYDACEIRVTPI